MRICSYTGDAVGTRWCAHFHVGVVPFDGLLEGELGALVDREEAARLALEYLGLERSRHRDQKNIVLQ